MVLAWAKNDNAKNRPLFFSIKKRTDIFFKGRLSGYITFIIIIFLVNSYLLLLLLLLLFSFFEELVNSY